MSRYFPGFREKARLSENRQETAAVLRLIRKNGINHINGLHAFRKTVRPDRRQAIEPLTLGIGGARG
jgi:hypothetical protein